MIGPRNVHPSELGDAEGMEVQDALSAGARLIEAMDEPPVMTGQDFTDRVMNAIADEPTPGTTGFLVPLRRRGSFAGLVESVRQAWAAIGGGRPLLARSAALAYVLAVAVAGVSLTGAATLGAAGALGLLDSGPTATPFDTAPAPTVAPPPTAPAPTPDVAPTEAPAPTPSPTETDDEPEASDDDGGNAGPGGGGNSGPGGGDDSGSDDDGGNSGPGGGDDSGSDDDSGKSGSGDDDSGASDDAGPGANNSGSGSKNSGSGSGDAR